MKKHNPTAYVAFACIAAILLITVILSTLNLPGKQGGSSDRPDEVSDNLSNVSEPASDQVPVADKPSAYYIIKTFGNGKIGVFENESDDPKIVISEIALMALPVFDRELLSRGITVYSDEDLYALIEDLDS